MKLKRRFLLNIISCIVATAFLVRIIPDMNISCYVGTYLCGYADKLDYDDTSGLYYYNYDKYMEILPMGSEMSKTSGATSFIVNFDNGSSYEMKAITIPSKIKGLNVTSISCGAFLGCRNLINATLPESITDVKWGAFLCCVKLKSLTFLNPKCKIADDILSRYFNGTIYGHANSTAQSYAEKYGYNFESLDKTIKLTKTTPNISIINASGCGKIINMKTVIWELDDKGTLYISGNGEMNDYEFSNDTYYNYDSPFSNYIIKKLVISKGITNIGNRAFRNCVSLENVEIPESVTRIGENSFFNCQNLKSIVIPNSVKNIEKYAFCDCINLENVTLSKSIKSIEVSVFRGCKKLVNITIPKGVTSISDMAFYDCLSLRSVIIPDSVESIGNDAFGECSNLDDLVISNGVEVIGNYAFYSCSKLKNVIIPESVKMICKYAFKDCSSLEDITIKNSNCNIGMFTHYDGQPYDYKGTIYGYQNSTAQKYAEKYGYKFKSLGNAPVNPTPLVTTTVTTNKPIKNTTTTTVTTKATTAKTTKQSKVTTTRFSKSTTTTIKTSLTRSSRKTTTSSTMTTTAKTTTTKSTKKSTSNTKESSVTTVTTVTTPTKPIPVYSKGDANEDGAINVRDAALIAKCLSKTIESTLPDTADFNGDGKISVRDAAAIARFLSLGMK